MMLDTAGGAGNLKRQGDWAERWHGWQVAMPLAIMAVIVTAGAGSAGGNEPASPLRAARPDPVAAYTEPAVRLIGPPADSSSLDVERLERLGPAEPVSDALAPANVSPDFRRLIWPAFDFAVVWEPESGGLALSVYEARVSVPTFPVFGAPLFVTTGFGLTDLVAPEHYELPGSLYQASLGLSGMRKLNDRWMLRWIAGSTFASDGENASSDAWRFHGGAFGVWQCHAQWQLTLGALATGREDLPVLPAAGAIWLPTDRVRVELMMPRPRISLLVVERDGRQQWCYAGGGLGGGTWAVERPDHTSDLLTYRE